MCVFPSDDRVSSLVEGTYYDSKGKRCEGAFLSVDDAYLIVNVNVFDKLIYESTYTVVEETKGVLSYEEVKAQFGDRIIEEYLAEQESKKKVLEEERKVKVEQSKVDRTTKARETRSKYADTKRKNILEMLLKGCKPAEITSYLGYTSSVVYKALGSFEHDFVYDCYNNDFVKKHIIREADFKKFVNLGFDYKRYLKYINEKKDNMSDEAPKPKREVVVEEEKKEVEPIWGTSLPSIEPKPVVKVDENEELPSYLTRESERNLIEQAVLEVENEALDYYKNQKKGLKSRDMNTVSSPVVLNTVYEHEVVDIPVYEEEEYDGETDEWGNAV